MKKAAAEEELKKRTPETADGFPPNSGENPKGGRPKKANSSRAVSERTGIPEETVRLAEAHVAAADRYPFLQAPGWSQAAAMEAAGKLDGIPGRDRKRITDLISEYDAPPGDLRGGGEASRRGTPDGGWYLKRYQK